MQLKLELCNLDEIVSDAVDGMETYLPDKGVKILYKRQVRPVRTLADADRLQQVIVNVLSNAVKFSKPHSFVEVDLSVVAGMAYVTIKDTGAGIPPGSKKPSLAALPRSMRQTRKPFTAVVWECIFQNS